jgi:hypothetical protein
MSLWAISGWIEGFTGSSAGSWGNSIEGQIHDADDFGDDAILWSVPIPTDLEGGVATVLEDRVIGGVTTDRDHVTLWGLSLEPGKEGTLLFDNTWQAPAKWEQGDITFRGSGLAAASAEDEVAVIWIKEYRTYYGFSLETGDYLWETDPQHYLQIYVGTNEVIYNGKLYSTGVSGILYCYDITTGATIWTYEIEDYYQENLWSNNWWGEINFIADGKIYVSVSEHSPIDPKPRGAPGFMCLDAESGNVIWRADGLFRSTHWGDLGIIGDSIIATADSYDQRVYAIGRGPSAITVEKPQMVAELGSAVTIHGTVMDISPGTEDAIIRMRFPNGVPAISDNNMNDWMLYVHKNFERPADATGVAIKVEAVTPSGGYENLGTITSDTYGNWAFGWCPEETGTYTIIATFEGSKAYFGSTQTSYLTVADTLAPPEVDLSSLEDSVNSQATYSLAILVIVIIALLVAVYSLLKK